MIKTIIVASAIVLFGAAAQAQQQSPAMTSQTQTVKRTPLQKFDVPGTNYETVTVMAEIVANVNIGKHTHPGPETGYIVEGDMTLLIEGEPPLDVKEGQSYKIPPGAVHDAKTGPKGARVVVTYVVEKGKPLASPVQ